MKTILTFILAALLVGCGSIWSHTVTLTQIRDSVMKELAALSAQGKISEATDAKIAKADLVYRQSAEVAAKALVVYKSTGNETDYVAALQAAKVAVTGLLDILTPLIAPTEAIQLKTQLSKATKL